MYKNLNPSAIGIFGRQSELVEIALTHRFKGLEIDITEVTKRAQTTSVAQACRYLCSAPLTIAGFELPIRWAGDEKEFQADLAQLPLLLEVANSLNADRCTTTIRPTCDQRPFHENFKFHVERLSKLADALAAGNVKLALNFLAAPSDRADGGFEFIHQADPTLLLINTIGKDNVGLLLDSWNWVVGGGEFDKLRALRGEQIVGVRLADIPTGADVSAISEEQRVLPGEGGTIDSAALLGLLDEIGFDGPIAAAPWPGSSKGQKREETVKKASAVLDAVLTGVDGAKPVEAAGQ
jgi:sugar phosphate isomerase/epimerase